MLVIVPEPARPGLSSVSSSSELARWYWTKDELAVECRRRGLAASGAKDHLIARLGARLDGAIPLSHAPRKPSTRQLSGPIDSATVIPTGQRCSQVLRAWFEEQIGPSFHFDAEMRDFVGESNGTRTLGDALEHWNATRTLSGREIGAQFELNRFLRKWHSQNPGRDHGEAVSAWKAHRALPIELREVDLVAECGTIEGGPQLGDTAR